MNERRQAERGHRPSSRKAVRGTTSGKRKVVSVKDAIAFYEKNAAKLALERIEARCRFPSCERAAVRRGLCTSCSQRVYVAVKEGLSTLDYLTAIGLLAPFIPLNSRRHVKLDSQL